MTRRKFIGSLAARNGDSVEPTVCTQASPVAIGILHAEARKEESSSQLGAFKEAMRQLGYVEGNNVRFVYRFADGFAGPSSRSGSRVGPVEIRLIVSSPVPADLAARDATSTIPIVMAVALIRLALAW